MTRQEEYEYLLRRSKRFYETAIMQIERGLCDLADFNLKQTLQHTPKSCVKKLLREGEEGLCPGI